MNPPKMIAIDGPAASGKSTLAEKLAARLGYMFFDTGVMYRAITYASLQRLSSVQDEAAVTELAQTCHIEVLPATKDDGRKNDVWLDGEEITWKIRQPEVEANVSVVSAYPGVRKAMSAQQRRIGLRGTIVMAGRDIGTVVLPEAELKIYLDASVEARAMRRYNEIKEKGKPLPYEEVLASMKYRDEINSTRACAPLRPAKDAVIINSDNLEIEDVVEKVVKLLS